MQFDSDNFLHEKTMMYFDNEKLQYIRYSFKLKDLQHDNNGVDFVNKVYSMKLDSNLSGNHILKDRHTTVDLLKAFEKIYNSDVIDFTELLNLYNFEDKNTKDILEVHLNEFFKLYNCEFETCYEKDEIGEVLRLTMSGVIKSKEFNDRFTKEIDSVASNSKLINNNKFHIFFSKLKNKVYSK